MGFLKYSDWESGHGRVTSSGGNLLDDLLTPCAGTLRPIHSLYIKLVTNSASLLYYILLFFGRERQHCSLTTIA